MKSNTSKHLQDLGIVSFRNTANALHASFHEKMEQFGPNLFRVVKTKHLSSGYLNTFDDGLTDTRKEHDCTACREFMRQWGNLAFIDNLGNVIPAYWDAELATPGYQAAVAYLEQHVAGHRIDGVAYSETNELGSVNCGGFDHFGIILDAGTVKVPNGSLQTALALEAIKGEHFKTLRAALDEYAPVYLQQVMQLIKTEKLNNAAEFEGQVQFLLTTHERLKAARKISKENARNLLWRIVAETNPAYCTPRSSVIGSLLDALIAGENVNSAVADFNERTRPEKYRRPVAAPTAGNVARAEKLFEQLNLAPALERRIALLAEVPTIWAPKESAAQAKSEGGVFGHLETKDQKRKRPVKELPAINAGDISYAKFQRTVLPDAKKLELYITGGAQPFGCLVTAVNEKAQPLFKWDSLEKRNPVSFYVHVKGERGMNFGLDEREFVEVKGITRMPWLFNAKGDDLNEGVFFVLDEAEDASTDTLAIFPQDLRHELHEVRSTIEAFSNAGTMQQPGPGQRAAGVQVNGRGFIYKVRVTTDLGVAIYNIDRME